MSAIPWVGQDIVEFLKIIKPKSLETIGVVHKNALKTGKILLKIDKPLHYKEIIKLALDNRRS